MISLQIKNTKDFMAKLLASDIFDDFLMESATIETSNTFSIDGHVNREFWGEDRDENAPKYDLSSWSDMRGRCFDLIKGKRTPLSFKFIMCANPERKDELLSSGVRPLVSSLVFIIRFSDGHITLTTGAALSGFSLDKSYEKVWDDYIRSFLSTALIDFEENF
jgi:hypothetical protein